MSRIGRSRTLPLCLALAAGCTNVRLYQEAAQYHAAFSSWRLRDALELADGHASYHQRACLNLELWNHEDALGSLEKLLAQPLQNLENLSPADETAYSKQINDAAEIRGLISAAYLGQGNFAEALAAVDEGFLDHGVEVPTLASAHFELARAAIDIEAGRPAEALRRNNAARHALLELTRSNLEASVALHRVELGLVAAHLEVGSFGAAARLAAGVDQSIARQFGSDSPSRLPALLGLVRAMLGAAELSPQLAKDELAAIRKAVDECVVFSARAFREDHPRHGEVLVELYRLRRLEGHSKEEALAELEVALKLAAGSDYRQSTLRAKALMYSGEAGPQGDSVEDLMAAVEALQESRLVFSNWYPPSHPRVTAVRRALSQAQIRLASNQAAGRGGAAERGAWTDWLGALDEERGLLDDAMPHLSVFDRPLASRVGQARLAYALYQADAATLARMYPQVLGAKGRSYVANVRGHDHIEDDPGAERERETLYGTVRRLAAHFHDVAADVEVDVRTSLLGSRRFNLFRDFWAVDSFHQIQDLRDATRRLHQQSSSRESASGPPSVPLLQSRLPSRTVVVDYLLVATGTAWEYTAWIYSGTGGVRAVALGPAETIQGATERYRDSLDACNDYRDAEFRALGSALRELVWDPVAAHLPSDVTEVILVPDGVIARIPFAVLPLAGSTPVGPNEATLVDAYGLQFAPNAAYLSVDRGGPTGRGLLTVAGVNFDRRTGFRAAYDDEVGHPATRSLRFDVLDATNREAVAAVGGFKKRYPGESVRQLSWEEASESAFVRDAEGHRVVHVATHGFAVDELQRLLDESVPGQIYGSLGDHSTWLCVGLALAGANRPYDASLGWDDGKLTGLEASMLDLRGTELLVISACHGNAVLGRLSAAARDEVKQAVRVRLFVEDGSGRARLASPRLWRPPRVDLAPRSRGTQRSREALFLASPAWTPPDRSACRRPSQATRRTAGWRRRNRNTATARRLPSQQYFMPGRSNAHR